MAGVEGKTILVTGAARGMGRSHVKLLAAKGANVIIADLLTQEIEALAREIGAHALPVTLDVTNWQHWTRAIEAAEQKFGPLSGLVNNAGIGGQVSFDDLTETRFREFIEINQMSVFYGMKAAVPSLRRAGGGSIVNISSTAGLKAGEGLLAYVATKFAVTGMSKAAALDLGPENIRVNSVHPGLIGETGLYERAKHRIGAVLDRTPLRRVADPLEVSSLVYYLLSEESGFCTGSEFVVDGGLLARQ
jgi:3alpha(or 20beta)-hydroxysteroid dehydrogenase